MLAGLFYNLQILRYEFKLMVSLRDFVYLNLNNPRYYYLDMNKYDLESRTRLFSKSIISLCRELPKNEINRPLVNQLVRSATSVGANYREANGASSRKDFKVKIHICKKEAQETHYWLELLEESNQVLNPLINPLTDESHQLVRIFGKITSTISKEPS
jgi:four helix bundle protein